jgi:hypothetical protein
MTKKLIIDGQQLNSRRQLNSDGQQLNSDGQPIYIDGLLSCRPVLVVEEAGVPGENHRPWATNW